MPIETGPGEEFQFDWSDCNVWARRWGWDDELHCFGTVLCWCRRKRWWFAASIDRAHTLEGLAGWFDDLDGVPAVGPHRPDGSARPLAWPLVPLGAGGVGVRPSLRRRVEGVPGR